MKIKFFLIILGMSALALCLCSQVSAAEIKNSGFEDGGSKYWDGWNTRGFKRDFNSTEEAKSGGRSYKVACSGESPVWGAALAWQVISTKVTPGDNFEVGVWMKISGADKSTGLKNAEAYLEIIFYDGKGHEDINEVKKVASGKYESPMDWTDVTISGRVPAGAVDCRVQLVVNSPGGGEVEGAVYFDDLSFETKK